MNLLKTKKKDYCLIIHIPVEIQSENRRMKELCSSMKKKRLNHLMYTTFIGTFIMLI